MDTTALPLADVLAEMLRRAVLARNAAYTERGAHTPSYWCNGNDGLAVVGDVLTDDIMEAIGPERFSAIWGRFPEARP